MKGEGKEFSLGEILRAAPACCACVLRLCDAGAHSVSGRQQWLKALLSSSALAQTLPSESHGSDFCLQSSMYRDRFHFPLVFSIQLSLFSKRKLASAVEHWLRFYPDVVSGDKKISCSSVY